MSTTTEPPAPRRHIEDRVVHAAAAYVHLYRDELAARPEGGTSHELLAAVDALLEQEPAP